MLTRRATMLSVLVLVTAGTVALSAIDGATQTKPMPPNHPPTGGQGGGPSVPPGHPPMGGAQPSIPGPPAESGTGKQALMWAVPSGWTKETPASSMRRAQYKINGPGGPAECVVFYFGPGQGGDTPGNIERWIGQFRTPDGKPVTNAKTQAITVGDIPITMVEVSGTYVGGMGSATSGGEHPNSMLLGAIADGPDAKWFFRATGPKKTLEPQRANFEKMIRSIKRGT